MCWPYIELFEEAEVSQHRRGLHNQSRTNKYTNSNRMNGNLENRVHKIKHKLSLNAIIKMTNPKVCIHYLIF